MIRVLVAQPDLNPYQRSLYTELSKFGVTYDIQFLKLNDYIKKIAKNYDVIHLHWLHRFYQSRNKYLALLKATLFIKFLKRMKKRQTAIVVTIHNILPHTLRFESIENSISKKIGRIADAIIFHDISAQEEYFRLFDDYSTKSHIIHHGVYKESLVPLPDKGESKKYLGIKNNNTCVLYLGKASKRKGYDLAVKTARDKMNSDIHFIFAGVGCDRKDFVDAQNCTVLDYLVPDYELPVLFAATDFLLLPYRNCTTSGLANLSIGYATPFLCSNVSYLKDLCRRGFGVIYNIEDPRDFREKIEVAKRQIGTHQYGVLRNDFIEENSWKNCAQKTYQLYRDVIVRRISSSHGK